MAEKIKLSGVPETMLQTVYARAKESTGRGVIQSTNWTTIFPSQTRILLCAAV